MDKSLLRKFTKNGTRHTKRFMGDSSVFAYRIFLNWIGKRNETTLKYTEVM